MARYGFSALFAILLTGLFSAASATAAEPPKPSLAAQQTACSRGDGRSPIGSNGEPGAPGTRCAL